MAAFKLSKLRQVYRDLGDILETYDALKAAEGAASDNEQPEGGSKARAAATNSGTASDSAAKGQFVAASQGQFVAATKGLTHIPQTAAVSALEAAIPAMTRLRGKY